MPPRKCYNLCVINFIKELFIMAKKNTSNLVSAILYILVGVLLIVFKSATLGWAMTIAGVIFIIENYQSKK